MANTKLSAFFSLLLVFCSGAVVGAIGYRVYNTAVAPPPRVAERRPDPAELRKQLIDETTREVHLDAQQVVDLGKIYDETRERFNEFRKNSNIEGRKIWDDQVSKIRQMLRPEQVPLYEKLRAKKDAEREANDRKKGGRKNGPPGDK
jgi:hypothetical protein